MYSNSDILKFGSLFSGNTSGFGVTEVGEIVDGKAQSKSRFIKDAVTPVVIQNHLDGRQSIGMAPIKEDSTCSFGAIDIDNYKYRLEDIVAAIYDFNIPLVPCWSKSKKLHLYAFFNDDPNAEDVISYLKWYVSAFGCDSKTEIFPKQKATSSSNRFYSWINLPYFDANNTENHRKMLNRKCDLVPFSSALIQMEEKRISFDDHKEWIQNFFYHDAPPCVLSGILLRDIGPGQRNNWLFSVGVYLRLKDENIDIEQELIEVNNSLCQPLPERELRETVIKGFQRKTYYYMCAAMDRCNKSACRQQEFGIESKATTGLDYGDITQYLTDPPFYAWIVNGQKLTFWNEQEVLLQNKFRALCLRQLHIVPRRVKDDTWAKILNRALEHITVVEQTQDVGDFTSGSTFFDLTCQFFNERRAAENITQIVNGRVFKDMERKEFVFLAKAFIDHIVVKHDFKQYAPIEMRVRLQQMGAYREGNSWRLPMSAIPAPKIEKAVFNFRNTNEGEGDY